MTIGSTASRPPPLTTPTTAGAWRLLRGELQRFIAARVAPSEVDDLVQEALLRIHRGLPTVRDPQRMSAWIYQVARSAIADHGRRKRPEVALEADPAAGPAPGAEEVSAAPDAPPAPAFDDEDDAAFSALAACIRSFVAMLPSPYREAISLVELEGRSQVEAAAALGVPLSTLKSRVQRGRAQLRELLEACCAIELDARSHVVDLVPRAALIGRSRASAAARSARTATTTATGAPAGGA